MTGKPIQQRRRVTLPAMLCAGLLLAACGNEGTGGLTGGLFGASAGADQGARVGQDVERPDIFAVTDRGLWDGRPSLGGIWVAHPDVREPERVIIRNTLNGQSTTGALFRRERDNPGPALQVSSDAAEALGILAGAPTELAVTVLRRLEVAEPGDNALAGPADIGAAADLSAPDTITATPLDPVATAPAAPEDRVEVNLPAAAAAPANAAAPAALPQGTLAQIGVFGVQANADAAAGRLNAAGFNAQVVPLQSSWRVVAGPVADEAALARIKGLGFTDAYLIRN
ncbi:SPOR domain-containing protein [Yoonia sp.]|uniref:SPOR domain-containing protein n=1 Tax=Yoonia sp. TaxID=2212373 RepID=UPI003919B716